jgi:MoaA/NifB/PqqE/SkfB family radical SAM enzyme
VGTVRRAGFLPIRTVHLHATLRCNLACLHCYSSSSPAEREALDLPAIVRALAALRAEGYEALALSGGEPLLYPRLAELVESAAHLGYRISLVTNGTRVPACPERVLARLDRVAVSFDGLEAAHDRMRGRTGAFRRAVGALDHLRALGKPAAMAFTVTRTSLPDVPAAVDLAVGHGVSALQLRPIVGAGRAADLCGSELLDGSDLARLYLLGRLLDASAGSALAVHTDLVHTGEIAEDREAYAAALEGDPAEQLLGDLVNPLVVRSDGVLKPFTFDFPGRFDLGTVADLDAAGVASLKRTRFAAFRELLGRVFDAVRDEDRFVDWFFLCRELGETLPLRSRSS